MCSFVSLLNQTPMASQSPIPRRYPGPSRVSKSSSQPGVRHPSGAKEGGVGQGHPMRNHSNCTPNCYLSKEQQCPCGNRQEQLLKKDGDGPWAPVLSHNRDSLGIGDSASRPVTYSGRGGAETAGQEQNTGPAVAKNSGAQAEEGQKQGDVTSLSLSVRPACHTLSPLSKKRRGAGREERERGRQEREKGKKK